MIKQLQLIYSNYAIKKMEEKYKLSIITEKSELENGLKQITEKEQANISKKQISYQGMIIRKETKNSLMFTITPKFIVLISMAMLLIGVEIGYTLQLQDSIKMYKNTIEQQRVEIDYLTKHLLPLEEQYIVTD